MKTMNLSTLEKKRAALIIERDRAEKAYRAGKAAFAKAQAAFAKLKAARRAAGNKVNSLHYRCQELGWQVRRAKQAERERKQAAAQAKRLERDAKAFNAALARPAPEPVDVSDVPGSGVLP